MVIKMKSSVSQLSVVYDGMCDVGCDDGCDVVWGVEGGCKVK